MAEAPDPATPPRWTTGSIVTFSIGLLILVPSGLCTGLFGIGAFLSGENLGGAMSTLLLALLVGGLPIALGVVLVRIALGMRQRSEGRPDDPD